MSRLAPLAFVWALLCVASFGVFGRMEKTVEVAAPASADTQTQKVVAAAKAFLNSLSSDQRENVQFTFTPQKTATAARFSRAGMVGEQKRPGGGPGMGIQGPKLVIEFSPQGVGGDATMHVHTMYRDPTNDYGRAFTDNSTK